MTLHKDYTVKDVQEVYDGPGGLLWELVMTEQIHSGGAAATDELARLAGIKPGTKVLDICSALGAPARHLASQYGALVEGIDMTETMLTKAIERTKAAGLADRVHFTSGNAIDLPYKKESFDVVWGQEAWCYVTDKNRLVQEAHRVLKPGGTIAFSDWVITGQIPDAELEPLLDSMAFPYLETFAGWQDLMRKNGFVVLKAIDNTEAYAREFDRYEKMVREEFKDKIVSGFGPELFAFAVNLVTIWQKAAHEHKVGSATYLGKKK